MNCLNCKKEIDDDSKFCEFCGNKVSKRHQEIPLLALERLNEKMWYRALKVLYFLGIGIGTVMALGVAIDAEAPIAFVVLTLITLVTLEIIKRSFYYIYLGKLFPKK